MVRNQRMSPNDLNLSLQGRDSAFSNMDIKCEFVLVRIVCTLLRCWTEIILSQENLDESATQVSLSTWSTISPIWSCYMESLFIIFRVKHGTTGAKCLDM